MTKLPHVLEMDPDAWLEAVAEVSEEVQAKITDILGEYGEVDGAQQALREAMRDYLIDEQEPGDDELWCKGVGPILFAGQKEGGEWLKLDVRDDGESGHRWWFRKEAWPQGLSRREGHRRVAKAIVEATDWGDEERAEERAQIQRAKREMWEPFLATVDAAGGGEASAADLREALKTLVQASLPAGEEDQVRVAVGERDVTHITVERLAEDSLHILAVSPGDSRAPQRLKDRFGMEADLEEGVVVITDHRKFVWLPFAHSQNASSELLLPSEPGEDGEHDWVDYYFAIDRAASLMIQSLNPSV